MAQTQREKKLLPYELWWICGSTGPVPCRCSVWQPSLPIVYIVGRPPGIWQARPAELTPIEAAGCPEVQCAEHCPCSSLIPLLACR